MEPVSDTVEKVAALREAAMVQKAQDLRDRREKAERWVNGYVATGATACFVSVVPGMGTAACIALETTMVYQIGKIYKNNFGMGEAAATAAVIGLATVVGKVAALEAAILLGPFAPPAKAAIGGGIIKVLGSVIIKHFEDCA